MRSASGAGAALRLAAVLFWSIAVSGTAALDAAASPWTFTPGVSVQATYTDNVGLDAKGAETSDFIFDVTPRFSLRKREGSEGGRIQLNVDYGLQRSSGGGSLADFAHQLQLDAQAEILRQRFFVDARATASQQNVSNLGRTSDASFSETGNTTRVLTVSMSPFLVHHFGPWADGEFRLSADAVVNQDVAESDSMSTRMESKLRSGRRFTRLPWNVSNSSQRIKNDDDSVTRFNRTLGRLSYVWDRHWTVFQELGYDSNEFQSNQEDTAGVRWRTGAIWTANARTRIEAGYGRDFAGSSVSFSLDYRRRRSVWSASYLEDVTTVRQAQLERILVPLVDEFGDPVVDPLSGAPVELPIEVPRITDEVFVSRRFESSVAYRGRRSSFTLRGFREERDFQVTASDETVTGTTATWSRTLSRDTTLTVDGGWQLSAPVGALEANRWDFGLSLRHRLGRNLRGSATYRRIEQISDDPTNEFTENRLGLSLSLNF